MEALVDHTNENIVYGTSQGGQFYKSTSGGNFGNANIQQPGGGAWVTPFVMHPSDPATIYVGLSNVRKTTNGMGSWTTISSFGGGDINNMYISESDPEFLYVSKSSTIYRTTDGGDSWDNISSGLPNLHISYIAVHPLTPETVAVCLSGYDNGDKVFITYDAGETWINFTHNLPNIPANCVIFNNDPNDGLYVGMDVSCYYRDNSLDEWEPFMEGLPNVIVNELEIHYESGKIRAATYGRGLWESDIHPVVPVDIVVSFNVNAGDDDVIEFGESVTLDIKLKNTMDIEAENIEMSISIENPFVEITDEYESFGTILPGDSITIVDAFGFDVSSSVPDDYQIKFFTQITSATDAWDGQIKLTAYAPAIEHGNIEIDDGDNGHLDPGETAIINMAIDNNGSISATDIEVAVSTVDPYVSISNTTASFDLLEAGGSEEMTINFEVDAATPIGHVINIYADITAANNYSTTDTIGFQVGTIMEDFETGDFTSYPWSFEGLAEWEIVNNEVYEGEFSARSGDINDQQESIMFLEMEVLAEGEISFYKKVSCEDHVGGTDYDYLAFFIDDDEQGRWDGEVDWSQETYSVSQGSHTFKWLYYKDYSVSSGDDCAWVDYIILPPVDQPVSVIEYKKEQTIEVYPNPFKNETVLSFSLIESQKVNLEVYNSNGERLVQLINNTIKDKGTYQIIWNGKNDSGNEVPNGIYFYQLTTDKSYSGKIILQR